MTLGLERMWNLCRRLEKLLPRGLLRPLRTPWARGVDGFAAWLQPDQKEALEAYFAGSQKDLRDYAEAALERTEPSARELRTLAYLLSPSAPELVPRLLRRLPSNPVRHALCLRLIRHRWLPLDQAREVAALIADPAMARQADAWLELLHGRGSTRMAALASLIDGDELDPLDPRHAPLRRALWDVDAADGNLAPLAEATINDLAAGGRPAGERALRLWLHAYLAPRLGHEQPDGRRRNARIEVTIRHAQALSNGAQLHATAPVATAETVTALTHGCGVNAAR